MQKARSHPERLLQLVSVWFQELFHSLVQGTFHLSLTVLVRYRSHNIFSLTRWFWQIHAEFHMFRATQDPVHRTSTFIRDYHPLWFHFPVDSEDLWLNYVRPTTPTMPKQGWFGLFPVRSPLLRESLIVFFSSGYLDVSVLRVCFHTSMDDYSSNNRVSPFGHLRIKMYVPLPVTFRSLSRPSSPLRAKVSPLRS